MIDLGDEFSNWWLINKFELMQDEAVGIREVARAAWLAGVKSAQQRLQSDGARFCPACHALLEERSVYCDNCGTDTPRR